MKYLKMFENIFNDEDWDEEEFDDDIENLIKKIQEKLSKITIDDYITMAEMVADSSPCLYNKNGVYHFIERLYKQSVEVVIYGGYKGEQEIDTYIKTYEQLDKDILIEIKTLVEDYYKNYVENEEN